MELNEVQLSSTEQHEALLDMEIPESPAERQFKTRELVKKLIEAL